MTAVTISPSPLNPQSKTGNTGTIINPNSGTVSSIQEQPIRGFDSVRPLPLTPQERLNQLKQNLESNLTIDTTSMPEDGIDFANFGLNQGENNLNFTGLTPLGNITLPPEFQEIAQPVAEIPLNQEHVQMPEAGAFEQQAVTAEPRQKQLLKQKLNQNKQLLPQKL